mmetsp:Transcript_23742/g.62030  ORF Transcript_23742/g.62030 Transcript_23742/m.62030 type:complete len:200 (+) Transcript_23742:2260-2859(+)
MMRRPTLPSLRCFSVARSMNVWISWLIPIAFRRPLCLRGAIVRVAFRTFLRHGKKRLESRTRRLRVCWPTPKSMQISSQSYHSPRPPSNRLLRRDHLDQLVLTALSLPSVQHLFKSGSQTLGWRRRRWRRTTTRMKRWLLPRRLSWTTLTLSWTMMILVTRTVAMVKSTMPSLMNCLMTKPMTKRRSFSWATFCTLLFL